MTCPLDDADESNFQDGLILVVEEASSGQGSDSGGRAESEGEPGVVASTGCSSGVASAAGVGEELTLASPSDTAHQAW